MQYRNLGLSPLKASVISFGCWQFERTWASDYSEKQLRAAAHCAIDNGINLFDTAAAYGNGDSERLLGKIVAKHRHTVLIATKVLATSYDAKYLEERVDESLKRLNIDTIDLYQIHWPKTSFTSNMCQDIVAGFQKLRDKGKIKYAGVSNFRSLELEHCSLPTDLFVANQLPYSLLWRNIEERDMNSSYQAGLSILTYSSLAQGYLTGKFINIQSIPSSHRANLWFSQPEYFSMIRDTVTQLEQLADKLGHSLVELAINWLLKKHNIASVICGARNPKQVEEQISASEWELSDEIVQQLDKITEPIKTQFHDKGSMWVGKRPEL